jgi:hypothetical protein
MRINGVLAIMQHLGYQCRKGVSYRMWRRLKAKKLPHYRDPDDERRVFAFSEELDVWDKRRANGEGSAEKAATREASRGPPGRFVNWAFY